MKELSIEEKAKAYDEAIERAREWSETKNGYYMPKELCEEIFPELKESEGEKIRKEITEFFKNYSENGTWKAIPDVTKWIAWLEKQGEQNPTLPKWKYKKDNTPLLRDSLILNKYGCVAKSPSGALVSDVWVIDYDELAKLPKEEFEKQGEQKSAVDTKVIIPKFRVGDIVKSKSQPMLSPRKIISIDEDCYWCEDRGCIGFAWEDDCEIVEQKPAWSEEDEEIYKKVKTAINSYYAPFSRDAEEMSKWFKSLKDRCLPQQKQEWSEEDATMLNDCVCAIQAADEVDYSIEDKDLLINWLKNKLKSLRPQSQWRPSEGHIFALESVIDSHPFANPRTKESLQDLVKQLKAL